MLPFDCFSELLSYYIIKIDNSAEKNYGNDDILMKVFEKYINLLKNDFEGDKSMYV